MRNMNAEARDLYYVLNGEDRESNQQNSRDYSTHAEQQMHMLESFC